MNKTEQVVLNGIKDSLDSVRHAQKDDNWEVFANRMRTTINTNVIMLENLLKLESQEENENEGIQL